MRSLVLPHARVTPTQGHQVAGLGFKLMLVQDSPARLSVRVTISEARHGERCRMGTASPEHQRQGVAQVLSWIISSKSLGPNRAACDGGP